MRYTLIDLEREITENFNETSFLQVPRNIDVSYPEDGTPFWRSPIEIGLLVGLIILIIIYFYYRRKNKE